MATGGRVEAVRVPPLATRRPAVPVEVLAARTLSLATLGPRRRAERRAQAHAELEALAGASLLELRRTLPGRYWILAMLSLTGKSVREIAAMVGYAGPAPVLKALRHPAVVKLIEEVRAAQLEAITSGSYGVLAAARAAAPAIAEHVVALAGGRSPAIPMEEAPEQRARHRHLGHLEPEGAPVRDDLRADLHHLLPEAGQ
jgi:hypothetical protein